MKHKRQTLGKSGDDGDDKDSVNSDGGKSSKLSSDKFLDDEMSKKSCQGCEMPTAGLCGTHDELPDITSTRGNNNNTPSATNNNTNFNNNSNGASSVGSSSSFDKLITEEDSRSNEDSGSHSSPRISKKGASTPSSVSVKTEGRRSSPNSCDRKIGLSKVSPSVSKETAVSEAMTLKVSPKNLTAPVVNNLHSNPLSMTSNMMYSHLQRSSPTTATAIASATVTIQNVASSVPPFATRGSVPHFPNQYQINNQAEYRADSRSKHPQPHYQMGQSLYSSSEMYNPDHPTVNDSQTYLRPPNHPNSVPHPTNRELPSRVPGRGRQSYHPSYSNQQQYYYNKNHGSANDGYNMSNQNYGHGYQNDHPAYNHYGYAAANIYPNESSEGIAPHVPSNSVHMGHESAPNYYPNESLHALQKNHDYPSKVAYYENNHYAASNQMPSSGDSSYISPEVFPNTNNTTVAIMTPPASVQTENSDNYNSFHQFYSSETSQNQMPPAGENSNSSSDFNFLSNLANDYTPEYYQI